MKAMSTEYTRFRSGVDAIVHYLKQHGPTVRQDALKAVVAGGWARATRTRTGC
jgi:hypothetical protein